MEKVKIIIILISWLSFSFLNAAIVECKKSPCTWADLNKSLSNLLRTGVQIAFFVALLMSTVGAFFIMFHGPNPGLYQKGVNLIKVALIGYVLILASGIIFDIILEFFRPKLKQTKIAFAAKDKKLEETTYYKPLRESIMSSLKCGKGADTALKRLFNCIFEALELLKTIALILLTGAIIVSGGFLIGSPIFGAKETIPKAKKILIWSIIGLIVVLTADIIKDQIERLTRTE